MIEWFSMDSFIQLLANSESYFSTHPLTGLMLAFSIALVESIAILGSLIPGIITMTFVGYLMGTGAIPMGSATICVFIGAFIGDYISYIAGRVFRPQIQKSSFYRKKERTFRYGEDLINKNAIMGLIVGRIIGPVRSTIPLIAGLINLPLKPFVIGASGSVIVWSFCYLTPGIIIGLLSDDFSSPLLRELPLNMLNWVIHCFFGAGLVYWLIKSFKNRQNHPESPNAYLQEIGVLTLLLLYITMIVYMRSDVLVLNDICLFIMQSMQHYTAIYVSCFLSIIADKYTLYGFCTVASIYLFLRRAYWSFILFSFATFGVGFAVKFFKIMVAYPRPEIMINLLGPTAFPSGHVGLYYTTVLALAAMLAHSYPKYKSRAFAIAHLSNVAVALSRIYLQAHWLTDIIGGIIFGYLFFIIPYATVYTHRFKLDHNPAMSSHLAYLFLSVALVVPIARLHVPSLTYHYNPSYYLIENRMHLLSKHQWQSSDTAMLSYAQNSYGISQYPLNIHLNMSFEKLSGYLSRNHWQSTTIDSQHLSAHFFAKKPDHIFIQSEDSRVRYLILWEKDHILKEDAPLFVGILMEQSSQKLSDGIFAKLDFNQVEKLNIPKTHKVTCHVDDAIPLALRLQHWNGHIVKIYE